MSSGSHAGGLYRRRQRRRVGAQPPQAGVPAPAYGAADGSRRLRRRKRLPRTRWGQRRIWPWPSPSRVQSLW